MMKIENYIDPPITREKLCTQILYIFCVFYLLNILNILKFFLHYIFS